MRRIRKKKQSRSKYVWIFALITLIVVIVVAVTVTYQSQPLPRVSEYLRLSHTKSLGKFHSSNLVEITSLGLNITAVGGDASSIVIQVDEGNQRYPENDVIKEVKKGESYEHVIELEGCILPLENGKCTVHIDISCVETGASKHELIPLEILQQDIVGVGVGS